MASLKTLRTRIRSVQETQKITTAMMLVSGAKLRKAEGDLKKSLPFIEGLENLLSKVSKIEAIDRIGVKLLASAGPKKRHLIVVMTSERGLCGSFNALIIRDVKNCLKDLENQGESFSILCLGRKGKDLLRSSFEGYFLKEDICLKEEGTDFEKATSLKDSLIHLYDQSFFDVCTLFYSRFYSIMKQVPQKEQLIPFFLPDIENSEKNQFLEEFEPAPQVFLNSFLEMYLSSRLMHARAQTRLSEQGARMMAMDGATRNAKEMIKSLTLLYNRSRQSTITKELIEIISGSEAL